jgi:COMPASS component SWD3
MQFAVESLHEQSSPTKLVPKVTISNNTSEVFSVRFTPDGQFVAAGCGDGAIRIFNSFTGALAYNLQGGSNVALPTTVVRFRPSSETNKTKNVLIAANATGAVQHWHMTSGKCLHSMEEEDGNQVYAMDYNLDGSQFVTAGKDTAIRVYDEATKSIVAKMKGGLGFSQTASPGHSNRIFSAKVVPQDQNLIISGGWDNTVQIWDMRKGGAVRSIYGPHLCGDALDLHENTLLTGSWRNKDQLELWDFGSGQKIGEVPWNAGLDRAPCMLYAAQFSRDPAARYIVAGGSGSNEAKVFDRQHGNAVVGTVTGLSRGVFAVDCSPDGTKIAIAGGDASVRILDLEDANSSK